MSAPSTGRRGRGELRIYLGAAPGVGKTFAMLGEARRRAERGCDVVVALVETHGRERTAEALAGLEILPRRVVDHRGAGLEEMDLDGVLARNPDVALVDELAHSNAPGARHEKRWQDVEELLAAGIDVLSTVNVQHLESLNDVVQRITGVVQQETVPDEVVRRAEQVELVDITPEALRRRLSHGNVYKPEKVDAALSNYFRAGNLTALRELALLWVADQVDAALAKYRADNAITDTWEARERVVVSVTGGPESETLVRRAKRIASRAGGELVVVHVVRGDGIAGTSPAGMLKVRKLAEAVGASVHSVVGDDVPSTLLEFARSVNATQLVLGTSRRSRWARMLDEGIGATVVRDSGPIDVHMVTHEEAGTRRLRLQRFTSSRHRAISWVAAVVVPALASLVLGAVGEVLDFSSQGVLYFLVVLGVSLLGGVGPSVLAALVSGALLNFFFTEPRYSFAVASPDNVVTLVVLMAVAIAVALLVDTSARRARDARSASREAELLALFASSVLRGADLPALLDKLVSTYGQTSASLLRRAEGNGPLRLAVSVGEDPAESEEDGDTVCEVAEGEFALVLTGPRLTARDRRVLRAVAYQAVGLLRQEELTAEAAGAEALAEADNLRRSLLSAVSHDLRTPLAAVKAGVSSLRSPDVEFSPEDTAELLAGVEESTDQLSALVANLLDSSRLAAGVVRPQVREVSCEEVVHRALVGVPQHERVHVDLTAATEPLPTVLADPGLLERVLANLLANALQHAPRGEVRVSVAEQDGRVSLRVADTGPGLPRGGVERVFEPFQRLGDRDNSTGVGLGLAVVKGFTEAMGGTVTAEDTPGGGLTMVVELPSAPRAPRVEPLREQVPRVTRVLVVDDEPQILRALRINLSARGYEVTTAVDGASALRAAAERNPEVVVLDLGLPDMDGTEVLAGIRGWSKVPVIVLSARTDSADKVDALDAGADDYVTKPFGMDELLARLRAAVRRGAAATEEDLPVVETASFTVDLAAKTVVRDGAEVHLTPTEWGMLEVLVRHRGKLVGQKALLQEVWGPAYATETHYLRVYLAQLRRKLEPEPARPRHLLTEAGMGYRFQV